MKKLRILLAGQKRFGRDVLEMITEDGHDVVAICCPVPKPQEKDDKLWISAANAGVAVIPSGCLNAENCPEVDLIVTAHSHDFIGKRTRNRSRFGAIGYHPSLLPLHRGRDAVRWAIRMGDKVTGGSVYWLTDTVDGGPLAAQKHVFIRPGDDALGLWVRDLAPLGVKLLRLAITDIANGKIVRQKQDTSLATWEPSFLGSPPLHRPDLLMLPAPGQRFEQFVNEIA